MIPSEISLQGCGHEPDLHNEQQCNRFKAWQRAGLPVEAIPQQKEPSFISRPHSGIE